MSRANKPVHPVEMVVNRDFSSMTCGMTLREHYAGLAMQGLLARGWYGDSSANEVAGHSRSLADALIAELERTA